MRVSRPVRLVLSALLAVAGAGLAAPAAAAEILSVKNESANFREGPGEKHPIVFAADRFYPVEVVEKKDGWAKIKDFEGDVAWVAARLLARQETVVVEGDRVNVRDKATTASEIAFKAERGEVFKVERRQGKWLKVVDASGDGGWIREDMVWGERPVVAASPKGKTKGELEAPAGGGDKGAEKGKAAPAKPEKTPREQAEGAPGGETPKGETPGTATPAEAPPRADAPKADAPKAEEPDAPEADAPKAEAPKADAPEPDAPEPEAKEPPADDAG